MLPMFGEVTLDLEGSVVCEWIVDVNKKVWVLPPRAVAIASGELTPANRQLVLRAIIAPIDRQVLAWVTR